MTYDFILIGSSPINLITLDILHSKGKKAVILEMRDTVGGCWHYTNVFGFKNIDYGPHIILLNSKVRGFLTKRYGINLDKVDHIRFCLDEKKVSTVRSSNLEYCLNVIRKNFKKLVSFQFNYKYIWRILLNSCMYIFYNFFSDYAVHAKGGCRELIFKVLEKVGGKSIKYNKKVLNIRKEGDIFVVETNGGSYSSKKILLNGGIDFYDFDIFEKKKKIYIKKPFQKKG